MKHVFLALLLLFVAAVPARADCMCTCVDGALQPLCTSGFDLPPPVCEPRYCPPPPPSVKPEEYNDALAEATGDCELKQVMNPHTDIYEWRVLCQ